MMQSIEHIDEIFRLLKKEMERYSLPIVSRAEGKEIIHTPFTTLISCILSLRTKDEVTEQASIRLLKKYDTPEKLIQLSEEKIQSLIYTVGLYKKKAKTINEI